MKTFHITAALLLAAAATSNAQATSPEAAFGPHFGLSYVYEIITVAAKEASKMMTKHKIYSKADTNYFTRVGTNGIGSTGTPVKSDGTSGMDGPFPLIKVFDSTGTVLTSTEAGDDGAPNPNAACISSIAVSPDKLSGSPTYALSAELIVSVDNSVPWYYSGRQSYARIPSNDCRPVRIPGVCFWLSQFVKKDYTPVYSIELDNIPEYVALLAAPEAKLPAPGSVRITRSVRQETPKPEPAPAAGAATVPTKRDVDKKPKGFNHANMGSESAKLLCKSSSSHGPSYLSTTEEQYCDMATHTLFPKCKSISEAGCYRIVNDAVSVVHKPDQVGDKDPAVTAESILLDLWLFGDDLDPMATPDSSLKKRAECIKGTAKAALNVGETLASTDFVASEEGGRYRLVVLGSTGDVIVYDAMFGSSEPSSIAVWKLGANGPRDSSYVAEVNASGQICSRTLAGVVLKCAGPVSPLGPTYQLTVSKMGAVYIKNGGTVVWTTDAQVVPNPHEIAGTVLTETNSLKSLDSLTEPSTLTSTNGKTTLEFKDAKLCLYNGFKFPTWCLPPPAGDNPEVRVTLTTRGSICILRTTNGPLSSSCSGNVGDETSYIAVVHDDGFLKVYNSALELVWQRGGA
ncbi:MAG: hypothetical protein JOS17DRAFT_802673 [Linnemannia elongata]|nr:MAG: hypothetical protein JOS17DRAFT_802673 [Linnemannia elongata]